MVFLLPWTSPPPTTRKVITPCSSTEVWQADRDAGASCRCSFQIAMALQLVTARSDHKRQRDFPHLGPDIRRRKHNREGARKRRKKEQEGERGFRRATRPKSIAEIEQEKNGRHLANAQHRAHRPPWRTEAPLGVASTSECAIPHRAQVHTKYVYHSIYST